jgi:hypothetical protein
MWYFLVFKVFGLAVVAFSKHIVNAVFDVYEYFERRTKGRG